MSIGDPVKTSCFRRILRARAVDDASRFRAGQSCLLCEARPDIAKWHVKVKMLFIIDQLQVLFDDMFSHACDNMDIVNVVIVLIHGFNSMVIFKVVIYGFL